jgi:hypothetical protein
VGGVAHNWDVSLRRELTAVDEVAAPGGQLVFSAVASRVAVSVRKSETVSVSRQSLHLHALARAWWKAFESAQSALRAASPHLGGNELGERGRRLAEERSDVARLLESLARDLQVDSGSVRWLATPGGSRG